MKRNNVSVFAFVVRAGQLAWHAFQERRLPLSPRRWLIDLRHLRGVMANHGPTVRTRLATAAEAARERDALVRAAEAELKTFLDSESLLTFQFHSAPVVSIILVLYNRAEFTLRCLRSLGLSPLPSEVILVDNASSDVTPALIEKIRHAVIVRHETNKGFSAGVNAGAQVARGKYLLFLNNDTELTPGSLDAAIARAESSPDIGAVGARLILPGGRLQEAGSIIWNDGTCLGYGRDESPLAPEYSFCRDVDFCSAAFLLTPRALFLELGGFDLAFSPAYYEDADYCVRLWKAGRRVVYEPACEVRHFEYASSPARHTAAERQRQKQKTFVDKQADWLRNQQRPDSSNVLVARSRPSTGQRILIFDDRVPHRGIGSGFPRAVEMIHQLTELGHFVTLYPLSFPTESWQSVYEDIPRTVEVITDAGPARVARFVADRRGYYDTIIVSRHHNMQRLCERLGPVSTWGARVVYDAEAVAAQREVERRRLNGESIDIERSAQLVRDEMNLARGVDVLMAVSEVDKQSFIRHGIDNAVIARHAVKVSPSPPPFDDRAGFLFVGAFDMMSPNQDSVLWFLEHVLPLVEARLGFDVRLTIAGHNMPAELMAMASDKIALFPNAVDLLALYDAARVFIAPTRFAAGVPLKIVHAAAAGVPVVCTSVLMHQLGWVNGCELLAADSPEAFADKAAALYSDPLLWRDIRERAIRRVENEYSPEVFRAALQRALDCSQATEGGVIGARVVQR